MSTVVCAKCPPKSAPLPRYPIKLRPFSPRAEPEEPFKPLSKRKIARACLTAIIFGLCVRARMPRCCAYARVASNRRSHALSQSLSSLYRCERCRRRYLSLRQLSLYSCLRFLIAYSRLKAGCSRPRQSRVRLRERKDIAICIVRAIILHSARVNLSWIIYKPPPLPRLGSGFNR